MAYTAWPARIWIGCLRAPPSHPAASSPNRCGCASSGRPFSTESIAGPDRRDQTDGSHGHCNLSARGLWEIHPVYWVKPP